MLVAQFGFVMLVILKRDLNSAFQLHYLLEKKRKVLSLNNNLGKIKDFETWHTKLKPPTLIVRASSLVIL